MVFMQLHFAPSKIFAAAHYLGYELQPFWKFLRKRFRFLLIFYFFSTILIVTGFYCSKFWITRRKGGCYEIRIFRWHLHTINHHKWLVTRDCIRVGLISQGLKHDLSKYAPIEFLRVWNIMRAEKEVRSIAKKKKKDIHRAGCIIRDATAIILNIGSITLSILKMVL